MSAPFDFVVASHLRWSFVWQRPQQLLSRLAQNHRILFVEEPVLTDSSRRAVPSLEKVADNITVLAPRVARPEREGTPIWADRATIAEQVLYAMQMLRFRRRALWFYTPLPEFLLHTVEPELVVYDVMDELANFKFAPAGLREQEARLLRRADVVFTGGASLYEAKLPFNANTHLFPSGVDRGHYASACAPETSVPDYVEAIPAPRAVYIGVIDERLDYEAIEQVRSSRPDLQFLMVGPIVKVDPAALPQGPNLHYLGQRDYADLPCILKGADVCLMPFAMNEATRFISPTKTLEYMATHRPIVSTPIRDVERFYSDIVYLARDPEEFVRQIDAAVNESAAERARRHERETKILGELAWDKIVGRMEHLMLDAYTRKAKAPATAGRIAARRAASPAGTGVGVSNPIRAASTGGAAATQ